MAEKKNEIKSALLLSPVKITENKQLLRFIQIRKNDKGLLYDITDLDESKIRRYCDKLPQQAQGALRYLNSEGLNKLEDEITKRFKVQKSGMPLRQFLLPAYTRQLQERFEMIKPFASLMKWYHQVPNAATGNILTAPCVFSNYKPVLKFEVVKEREQLKLITIISINGSDYQLETFRRFHFLLLSNNEYFLLSHKDYRTMEWLLQNDPHQYSQDATLFAQKILSVLETDYDVNRNNLFAVTTVEVLPVKRILLSEISKSFLVLTPQWLYDGYVAEGVWKESFEVSNNGEAFVIKRNKEEETTFKKLLEALHPNFVKQLNGYYYLSFADAQKKQWFLKVYHKLLEMDIEVIGMDMLTHFRYSSHKPVTSMQVVRKTTEILTVDFSLQFGEEKIPLAELQKILIAGQRAVMLKDGSLGIFPEEWLSTYSTIIRHSKIDKEQLALPQWMAISQQSNASEETVIQTSVTETWWNNWQRWQNSNDILYPVPENIKATLRPYQQKGFEWIKLLAEVNAGACLADDMGLGKTLQTICFIADKLQHLKNALVLIVCPSSLIYNWQQELNKFAPHLRTYIHHGNSREHQNIPPAATDVCITSYGTLRSDIEHLAAIHFNIAVIDESHNIKNPLAQITRAVNQLHASSRIALSGTPVMNNTFDLYAQLEF